MIKKVNVYVDGFNFYYALQNRIHDKSSWWTKEFQRCNFQKLFSNFLQEDEKLNKIYFFTAYRKQDKKTLLRHTTYIEALGKHNIRVVLWNYQSKINSYKKWKNPIEKIVCSNNILDEIAYISDLNALYYGTFEEKETDVKIALQIVEDAFLGEYDHAYIVSGDSDLIPAIETIKKLEKRHILTKKSFSSILLPGTKWYKIKRLCDFSYEITTQQIKNSILPHEIQVWLKTISIPSEWL